MSVTNSDGKGLLYVAPDQMAASAVHFRPEDNYTNRNSRSRHTYQFKSCDNTVVSLDAATRGLGNASCGSDVLDKYELKSTNTSFRFFTIPVTKDVDIAKAARVNMPVCQPVSCKRNSNGRISMTSKTSGATIYYSINDGEWTKYTGTILHNDACSVKAYCSYNGLLDSPVLSFDFDMYINKKGWKLVSVDSFQGGNEATLAFDNNLNTFWHTAWGTNEPKHAHTIVIDMINIYQVTAITYNARSDGNSNGMVKDYEVYLSTDGTNWGGAVVTGQFKNTTAMQIAKLNTPTPGRYLKFVAKSEINNNAWTSAAEIGIQASADVTAIEEVNYNKKGGALNSNLYYTLQGIATDSPSKGIYVHKGKKVLF
jgi:beta-galactosidase